MAQLDTAVAVAGGTPDGSTALASTRSNRNPWMASPRERRGLGGGTGSGGGASTAAAGAAGAADARDADADPALRRERAGVVSADAAVVAAGAAVPSVQVAKTSAARPAEREEMQRGT